MTCGSHDDCAHEFVGPEAADQGLEDEFNENPACAPCGNDGQEKPVILLLFTEKQDERQDKPYNTRRSRSGKGKAE